MQKRVWFLVLMISFICASSAFAIKGMKKTAGKSKISEVSKEDKVTTTEATSKDTTEKKSKKKKDKKTDKKEKKITKIFLPGHDKNNKDLVCQGIAYIPGETIKNGDPRYVLFTFTPNKEVSSAPVQLVVIDREKTDKNKAIKRFSLYKEQVVKSNSKDKKEVSESSSDADNEVNNTDEETKAKSNNNSSELEDSENDIDNQTDDNDIEAATTVDDDDEQPEISQVEDDNKKETSASDKDDDENDADKEAVGEKDEEDENDDNDDVAKGKALVNLPYRGHAGGVAVAGKYVWVASGFTLRGYDLDEIKAFIKDTNTQANAVKGLPKSMDQLPAKDIYMVKSYPVDSRASFVSFDGKYLWVGDYTRKNCKNSGVPVNHHKQFKHLGWVAGYLVDKDGCPTSNTSYSFTYKEKQRTVNKPDVVLAIRRRAQGIAICGDYIALSVSCGTKKSKLEIYKNPLVKDKNKKDDKKGSVTYKVGGTKYTVEGYNLSKKKRVNVISKPLPAQIQDLEFDGKKLYATFLCNAGKYKERHQNEKIVTSKNFYIIDFEQLVAKNIVSENKVLLDVPLKSQFKAKVPAPGSACGPTSLAMCLSYYGKGSPSKLVTDLYGVVGCVKGVGTSHAGLVKGAKKYGLKNAKFHYGVNQDWCRKQLAAGSPLLCNVNHHYVVLRGIDKKGRVTVNDPSHDGGSVRTMSWAKFAAWWKQGSNYACMSFQ